MMRVDSDALELVNKALGLSGKGAGLTEFLDGQLDQMIDVTSIIRRGRTQAATGGFYRATLENVHSVGAGTLITTQDPYNVVTGAIEPYPVPMPQQFDIWLISASVTRASGTGTLTAALFYDPPAATQGWGVNNSGAAVVAAPILPIGFWDSIVDQSGEFALQNAQNPMILPGLRLRRGTTLRFSSTSSAIATYDCNMILGVFPVTLGQDILST